VKIALAIAPHDAQPSAFVVFRDRLDVSIAKAAAMGYDGVELALAQAGDVDADEVRALLANHGMGISAVSSGRVFAEQHVWMTSPEASVRERAVEILMGLVDLADCLGARRVNIGRVRGGIQDGDTAEAAEARFAAGVRAVAGHAAMYGINLVIEPVNRYEINFLNSVDPDGIALVRRLGIPNVKLMPDVFHMNIEDASIAGADRRGRPSATATSRTASAGAPGQPIPTSARPRGPQDHRLRRLGRRRDPATPSADVAAAQASTTSGRSSPRRSPDGGQAMHQHTDQLALDLAATARCLRIDVLEMVHRAQTGHLSGPFSAAEIMAACTSPAAGRSADHPARIAIGSCCRRARGADPLCDARAAASPRRRAGDLSPLPTRLEGHPGPKLPGVEMVAGSAGSGTASQWGLEWPGPCRAAAQQPSGASAPSARAARARVCVLWATARTDAGVVWEGRCSQRSTGWATSPRSWTPTASSRRARRPT
jgi:sugar phosphate isomerase/epimerase